MIEVETIEIDGKDYTTQAENEKYVLLTNINDGHDYCLRRKEYIDNKLYYSKLDSEEEFDKAFENLSKLLKDTNY